MGMNASARSKGFNMQSALAFVDETYGEDARRRVLSALEPEARDIVSLPILVSGWYPFRVQVALYEAIDTVFGSGDKSLCWEIGKFACEHEMTTIHKLFLKVANLELWVKGGSLMWGRYYDSGGLVIEEFNDLDARVRIVDFDPLSKAYCNVFGGWLYRTLELHDRSGITIEHRECVLDGAEVCRHVARWTDNS